MEDKIYFTQKELAERWHCVEGTIINYRKNGMISYFQLPGSRKVLYPIDDIKRIESQNTIKEGGDKPKAEIKRVKPCVSTPKNKEWSI